MANLVAPKYTRGIIRADSAPYQSIYEASTTQKFALGTRLELGDNRWFRYAYNGGVALARGLMTQGASTAAVPFLKYLSVTQTGYAHAAGAAGTLRVLVTTGALATGVENCLAEGQLIVTTGTNINDVYRILASKHYDETHVDVLLDQPLRNAIAATDKVAMHPSRWYGTLVMPTTTATAAAAGVPLCAVPINNYFWAQTKGPCPMTVDTGDTLVIGGLGGIPATNAVAGAVGAATATAYAFPVYGRVLQIGAADEGALIDLNID